MNLKDVGKKVTGIMEILRDKTYVDEELISEELKKMGALGKVIEKIDAGETVGCYENCGFSASRKLTNPEKTIIIKLYDVTDGAQNIYLFAGSDYASVYGEYKANNNVDFIRFYEIVPKSKRRPVCTASDSVEIFEKAKNIGDEKMLSEENPGFFNRAGCELKIRKKDLTTMIECAREVGVEGCAIYACYQNVEGNDKMVTFILNPIKTIPGKHYEALYHELYVLKHDTDYKSTKPIKKSPFYDTIYLPLVSENKGG